MHALYKLYKYVRRAKSVICNPFGVELGIDFWVWNKVWSVFIHVASIYANFVWTKEIVYIRKEFNPHRICLEKTIMTAAVSLFQNTNMAAVTPCDNAL